MNATESTLIMRLWGCALGMALVLLLSTCGNSPMPASIFNQINQPVNTSLWQSSKELTVSNAAGLPEGKFIALLWASWCPTCRAGHDYLNRLAANGVALVGIDYKDDKAEAIIFLRQLGNPFRMIVDDSKGILASRLGSNSIPTAFIFDQSHNLRARVIGGINQRRWEKQGLAAWYDRL